MTTVTHNPFKVSSMAVLRYTRMLKVGVTPERVHNMFPHFYKHPYLARRALDRLTASGLIKKMSDGTWSITDRGSEYLKKTSQPYKGEHGHSKSR
jgi:ribosomal protein S19E (S16A)